MSATRMHYRVRVDDRWAWDDDGEFRTPSRRLAEEMAAANGGTVVRVTVSEEAVGLRWVGDESGGTWRDGDVEGYAGWAWRSGWSTGLWLGYADHPAASLDEAKAACEAAIKASWT